MTTTLAPISEEVEPTEVEPITLADLLEDLGGISPSRIRYIPYPGTATEKDVIEIRAHEKRIYELVDGVLVEKAMGLWESMIAATIIAAIHAFITPRKLGIVTGEAGMMRLFPNMELIRIPDVSFISIERLQNANAWGKPVPQLAADLAVEVLSESNTKKEMARKRREYFNAGVRLLWVVDPSTKTVDVFTAESTSITLREGQSLDGGDVLPGFTIELATLFATPKPM